MGLRLKQFNMKVRQDSSHPFIDVGLLGSDVDADVETLNLKTPWVTPEQFGAVLNDPSYATQNSNALEAAILECKQSKRSLFIPIGKLYVNRSFGINFSLKIFGEHTANTHYNYLNTNYNSVEYGSCIVDLREDSDPDDYLFEFYTSNAGCVELRDLYIDGCGNKKSAIYLKAAGWTAYFENVVIDHYLYHALTLNGQYDSRFTNLTIERCGRAKYQDNPVYALYLYDDETNTNTNAISFINFHIEFCRYYIELEKAQDIVFTGGKLEVMRYVNDQAGYDYDIYGVDTDLTNPHILYDAYSTGIIFDGMSFCFRGIHNWLEANGNISYSSVPFAFKVKGNANEHSSITFNSCRIFSPDNDGGFRFLSNNAATSFVPVMFNNCVLQNLALTASAMEGNGVFINACKLQFFVHSSLSNVTGVQSVLYNSSISNSLIRISSDSLNRLSSDNIVPITSNSIMTSNIYNNFKNMASGEQNFSGTISAASGSENTATLTPTHEGSKKHIVASISMPGTGSNGTVRIVAALKQGNVDLARQSTTWTNNTFNATFSADAFVAKGSSITLMVYHNGTNTVNVSYSVKIIDI